RFSRSMDTSHRNDRQWHEEAIDFPLKDRSEILTECAPSESDFRDHADNIRPNDIDFYIEMGHLSRYCGRNTTQLLQGKLDSCAQPGYAMELPSIDKFLRIFNENLTVIESTVESKLSIQRDYLVKKFNEDNTEWNKRWKLIIIMPSLQDGEASESGQAAIEVLDTIEELYNVVPNRTIIVVIRTSGIGIWQDAAHTHQACRSMLQRFKMYSKFNSASVWDQVEAICETHFQNEMFSVQILPLLKDAALVNLPDNTMDLSVLGYDCSHFSERGLSLFHINIWNSILTKEPERTQAFRPVFISPQCADPQCPFIRTHNNSALCLWNPKPSKDEEVNDYCEQFIAVIALLSAIVPCMVLVVVLCRRRRHDRVTEIDSTPPLKAVGEDWTSIRFIDEDSVC
uniref:Phospholipase B1, membrane-associated n=1 Tax=Parascaris univalens TaxID=6257 RepID=A0A915BBF4_PARUN